MGRKNKKQNAKSGGANQNPSPQVAQANKSEAAGSAPSKPPQSAPPEKPAPVVADLPKGAKRDVNELVTQLLESEYCLNRLGHGNGTYSHRKYRCTIMDLFQVLF